MPSLSAYHLTCVSLTLDVGYLFRAAPAKCRSTPAATDHTEARRLRWTSQMCGREKLPHVRGQGWWPRVPGCDGAGTAQRSSPTPEVSKITPFHLDTLTIFHSTESDDIPKHFAIAKSFLQVLVTFSLHSFKPSLTSSSKFIRYVLAVSLKFFSLLLANSS